MFRFVVGIVVLSLLVVLEAWALAHLGILLADLTYDWLFVTDTDDKKE